MTLDKILILVAALAALALIALAVGWIKQWLKGLLLKRRESGERDTPDDPHNEENVRGFDALTHVHSSAVGSQHRAESSNERDGSQQENEGSVGLVHKEGQSDSAVASEDPLLELIRALKSVFVEVGNNSSLAAQVQGLAERVSTTEQHIDSIQSLIKLIEPADCARTRTEAERAQRESDDSSLAEALHSVVARSEEEGELRTGLQELGETTVDLSRRLEALRVSVDSLREQSLSRAEHERALRELATKQAQSLEQRFATEAEEKRRHLLQRKDWPPPWFEKLLESASDNPASSTLQALCFSISVLDREKDRFRVLAELLGIEAGYSYCTVAHSLPPRKHSEILEDLNSWLRAVEYPFDVFYPVKGDGVDPDTHHVETTTSGSNRGAVSDVLCWGLRERGGRPRIIAKAIVRVS